MSNILKEIHDESEEAYREGVAKQTEVYWQALHGPVDEKSETIVLSALINNRGVTKELMELLTPEDFWYRDHTILFSIMKTLYDNSYEITWMTVTKLLDMAGLMEKVGDWKHLKKYVIMDSSYAPRLPYVIQQAKLVRTNSEERHKKGMPISGEKLYNSWGGEMDLSPLMSPS